MSGFPLTRFLCALIRYPAGRLHQADPDKAAAHYGISRTHAAGYIAMARALHGGSEGQA